MRPTQEPPTTPAALFTWLGIDPRPVGRTFTLTAPVAGITSLDASMATGSHHEHYRPLDVFERVILSLARPAISFEAGLGGLHGVPLEVTQPARRAGGIVSASACFRRYGSWLVTDRDVVWNRFLPEWAIAVVDDDARLEVLARLLACARATREVDDLKAFAVANPCPGISWNTRNRGGVYLFLAPSLPVERVVALLGDRLHTLRWKGVGVHLAGHELEREDGRLMIVPFRVGIGLAGLPNGGDGWDTPVDPLDRVSTMSLSNR